MALLKQSDGVLRVERRVAVDRPKHRIVHILDRHVVGVDQLAVDLRDQDPNVSYADIEAEYRAVMDSARRAQRGQRALIRCLAKRDGVHRVYVEGLTDDNLKAYLALVRAFHRRADRMPPQLGAAAQALAAGKLEGVAPVEDEAAYKQADPLPAAALFSRGPRTTPAKRRSSADCLTAARWRLSCWAKRTIFRGTSRRWEIASICGSSSKDGRLTIDLCQYELHCRGWSTGDALVHSPAGPVWLVYAHQADQRIVAKAPSQAAAWRLVVKQAEDAEGETMAAPVGEMAG